MKYISFRLEQDSVDDLLNAMKALYPLEANITVAKGMKLLASGLIKGKVNTITNTDIVATDDFIKTTCYLTPNQRLSLEKAAKKHGWTLSRECRYRLQTTIENELDFFDQELLMMNRCRNAIDKIGRNFHYIIMNNENRIMDKDGFNEDVAQLKNQLEQLKSQFETYIKLCKGRTVSNKVEV
ncbi:DNA distortion polypeptide 1 [Salmonella enterica subsp. enterica serovar Oranienburg]|nr:DNA distortion polypeptide 1 [Salmonella enterica subsp. enterica serovar Oranienburg]EED3793393.1 DNA distortion polypeptide 1 [Salmonella enterica subsp. enterica serovar Oranienburg]